MIKRCICFVLLLFLGTFRLFSQSLQESIEIAEQLLATRQYSKAKDYIRICIHDNFTEADFINTNKEKLIQLERLSNDLREAQIQTGDFLSVYEDFTSGKLEFQSKREYLRLFHLNSLWLRSAPIRSVYGLNECHDMNRRCVEAAYTAFQQYADEIPDREQIQRIVWNDMLIAYGDIPSYEGFERVLDLMKDSVEGIPYSSPNWPSVYWYYRAVLERRDGDFEESQRMMKKVLLHCLEYNPDFAVNPWSVYSTTEAALGDIKEAHDISERTFKAFQKEELEQMRSMGKQDRYASSWNPSQSRFYYLLPSLPEGTFEDVLYDAVLWSKNRLLDLDREIADFVLSCDNEDLKYSFESMNYLSGDETSWYSSYLFQGQYERLRGVASDKEYSWKSVERKLGPNDVAIEFFRSGPGYSEYKALVIRKGWQRPVLVNIGSSKDLSYLGADARTHRENARVAGKQLFEPLQKFLEDGDDVYYSADGIIAQVNLDALQLGDGSLVESRYNIHRLTSTLNIPAFDEEKRYEAIFLYGDMSYDAPVEKVCKESTLYHKTLPLYMQEWVWEPDMSTGYDFGWIEDNGKLERSGYDNLKYTGAEIDNISKLWNLSGGRHVQKGYRSIEECFKYWGIRSQLPEHSIIHIATHSISRKLDMRKYWMISQMDEAFKCEGLLFTGSKTAIDGMPYPKETMNDQILWGEEIATLNLKNAELVVLSACHTARGKDSMDGILGLQRAFKEAGAKTILMTLWRVNDKATMFFMSAFYKALFAGNSKFDSYKEAQTYVRENYSDDPYYWAPFILLD